MSAFAAKLGASRPSGLRLPRLDSIAPYALNASDPKRERDRERRSVAQSARGTIERTERKPRPRGARCRTPREH
jgi:hypothetical protein